MMRLTLNWSHMPQQKQYMYGQAADDDAGLLRPIDTKMDAIKWDAILCGREIEVRNSFFRGKTQR